MSGTYETSPFLFSTEQEPWILWQKEESALALREKEQTDGRSDFSGYTTTDTTSEVSPSPKAVLPIKRAQYNSVLDRMQQASRKTSTFSAWQNNG